MRMSKSTVPAIVGAFVLGGLAAATAFGRPLSVRTSVPRWSQR
jgi:hypothetical protein